MVGEGCGGRGACVVVGGMHGSGRGACMVVRACMMGGVHGGRGHVW